MEDDSGGTKWGENSLLTDPCRDGGALSWGGGEALEERGARAARECSVLVGLHPDQATDAIVDLALRLRKPFAIVPCCVFPSDNPQRELNGVRVRSFRQFIDFLKAKDGAIREAALDFDGRNVLLYFRPEADPS